jgi:membrane protein YqaA with SNARE-associated domain
LIESISDMIHGLMDWVTHFAHTPYGGWALFGIAFVESSFFPIPPDVLLMALAVANPENSLWYATICTIGSVLGGCFGYVLGLKGGRPLMYKLFSKEKIAVVERYYRRWDVWAVGAAGLTPLPYKVFTISAGVCSLDFPRFLVASIASRALRFYAVGILFWLYGEPIQAFIKEYFGILSLVFFVLLIGGFWVIKHMGKKAVQEGAVQDSEADVCPK